MKDGILKFMFAAERTETFDSEVRDSCLQIFKVDEIIRFVFLSPWKVELK